MKVFFNIITWNNYNETRSLLASLKEEKDKIFFDTAINIVDNGSCSKLLEFLRQKREDGEIETLIENGENLGISKAKNKLIDLFLEKKGQWFFMFDNDIIPIVGFSNEMIKYMNSNPKVGCLGQNIDNYTKDINDENINKIFPKIREKDISINRKSGSGAVRAWTHFSVFRKEIFENGIRFDENGPFGLEGYGFDDDDLGMQIYLKGYEIHSFNNVKCYHNVNSSVDILKKRNSLNYNNRKEFFEKKWEKELENVRKCCNSDSQ